jgi:hypothetical protein
MLPTRSQKWLEDDRERFKFRWGKLHLSFALFESVEGRSRKLAWGLHHAQRCVFFLDFLLQLFPS